MSAPPDSVAERRARFERAVEVVREPVFRFVRRRAAAEVADDVMADTLLVLWRRLDEVIVGGELPFCLGVARRSLANQVRSANRRDRLVTKLSITARQHSVQTPVDAADDHFEVRRALAGLSPEGREILTLWAWDGLEAREIAVVLEITPNAAAIRLHRAKRRFADALERKKLLPSGQSVIGQTETR